jgi:hypothetical protein
VAGARDNDRTMTDLRYKPLMIQIRSADFASMLAIGAAPAGLRRIAPVTGEHRPTWPIYFMLKLVERRC